MTSATDADAMRHRVPPEYGEAYKAADLPDKQGGPPPAADRPGHVGMLSRTCAAISQFPGFAPTRRGKLP